MRSTAGLLSGVAVLLAWVAAAAVFFRRPLVSGIRSITGDNGDARLIIYLHEHWIQVLRGLVSWRNPAFFSPAGDTLGYTDTFVLDELFYAPLRVVGADPFLAYEVTLILLTLVGYAGAYRLLGRVLPDQRAIRAGLAVTFTCSNMMYVQGGHTQLSAIYWIPAIVLLLLRVHERPGRAVGAVFLAGLALGLLFLSTFYVAWFFTVTTLLWSAVRWALERRADPDVRSRHGREVLARYRKQALAGVVGAAIGGIPFLLVYLPNFGSSRSFGVVAGYAAQPRDVLNTGARNFLWGPPTRRIFGSSPRITNGELGFGLTPTLLVGLLAATVYLVQRFVRDTGDRRLLGSALATAVTCWAAILLPMKVFGLSLWYLIWLLVPGARAIRAIDRIGVIAGLLAPVVVAFVLADLLRRAGAAPAAGRRVVVGFGVLTLLLAFEQFNVGRNAGLDRTAELGALQAVPDPPRALPRLLPDRSHEPAPAGLRQQHRRHADLADRHLARHPAGHHQRLLRQFPRWIRGGCGPRQ